MTNKSNPSFKDDFYEAVNQEWLEKAIIPDDKPSTSSFQLLVETIEKNLMGDFKKMQDDPQSDHPKELNEFLKFYQLTLDTQKKEAYGVQPLLHVLKEIEDLHDMEDLKQHYVSLGNLGISLPVPFSVSPDMKNAQLNALYAEVPNLFLPDKTYYEADHPTAPKLLASLSDMSIKLLEKIGKSSEKATKIVENALQFDRSLAPFMRDSEEAADYSKIYNPHAFPEFSAYFPAFDIAPILTELIGEIPAKIIVSEPEYYAALAQLLTSDTFPMLRDWMLVKTVIHFSKYLTEEMRQLSGQYQLCLSGSKELMSLEKSAFYIATGTFDHVVGDYYGKTYFGEKAKEDVSLMVHNMIAVYQKRLETNDWLQDETKEKALLKLKRLGVNVGYPDQIPAIYSKLKVNPSVSLLENMLHFIQVKTKDHFSKWNQTVDRSEWGMSADTVNAYYHPFLNVIVFPAAILQEPFYSLSQSSSANYGGIGAVIAHEISHAFDNNGALFDEFGTLNNWWTKEDLAHFEGLAQQMVHQFDGLPILDGTVNGKLTVSENIADAGGLSCALEAAKQDKQVNLEAFFKNWATIWRNKSTPQYTELLLSMDVHAPAKLRANMQPRNLEEFYTTFAITEKDAMYLPENKRVKIW
ncbi:M13 family metallopeptidase [Vagococcus entomophilus]|uniref:Peptidase M13 n=1 Tax=Vagococcus entomophilus TaxID=1160095 RepID=A0A430AI79_9ENTE|nr:M13 family metallopeptidase [Vagococcus entomophilus]RSU07713.1 peptidase M13 [Vagococcus entomophilus]